MYCYPRSVLHIHRPLSVHHIWILNSLSSSKYLVLTLNDHFTLNDHIQNLVASANKTCSEAVVLLLLIYCLMYFPLFVGVLCLCLFCYALPCAISSFAIILKRKRKLVALLLLSYRCIVTILKAIKNATGTSVIFPILISLIHIVFVLTSVPNVGERFTKA